MHDLKLKFRRFFKGKWPYILLITLCLIFFYPVWFNKKIPLPLDALVGAYYPWLDYKWGYVVGVPFKNIALSDVFSQLYPWRILSMESLAVGTVLSFEYLYAYFRRSLGMGSVNYRAAGTLSLFYVSIS